MDSQLRVALSPAPQMRQTLHCLTSFLGQRRVRAPTAVAQSWPDYRSADVARFPYRRLDRPNAHTPLCTCFDRTSRATGVRSRADLRRRNRPCQSARMDRAGGASRRWSGADRRRDRGARGCIAGRLDRPRCTRLPSSGECRRCTARPWPAGVRSADPCDAARTRRRDSRQPLARNRRRAAPAHALARRRLHRGRTTLCERDRPPVSRAARSA